jgi:hypothetical protein
MRGQLNDIAADDRLTPESRAVVEWFAEQVKAATSGARLDELAELYAGQKIRRRHWWDGQPAAITAGYVEDDDGLGDEDEWDDEDDVPGPAVVLATPASVARQQQRMTWAEALAVNGWRIAPLPEWDGCQVASQGGNRCGSRETTQHVGPPGAGGGWACNQHYYALTQTIADTNQARGIL